MALHQRWPIRRAVLNLQPEVNTAKTCGLSSSPADSARCRVSAGRSVADHPHAAGAGGGGRLRWIGQAGPAGEHSKWEKKGYEVSKSKRGGPAAAWLDDLHMTGVFLRGDIFPGQQQKQST